MDYNTREYKDDQENEILSMLTSARACKPASFWREQNAIAVVILLQIFGEVVVRETIASYQILEDLSVCHRERD